MLAMYNTQTKIVETNEVLERQIIENDILPLEDVTTSYLYWDHKNLLKMFCIFLSEISI